MMRPPPISTLFPYTTLFRSLCSAGKTEWIHTPCKRPVRRTAKRTPGTGGTATRSEEHTSELQSQSNLVCRLLLEKKKQLENRLERLKPVELEHGYLHRCHEL